MPYCDSCDRHESIANGRWHQICGSCFHVYRTKLALKFEYRLVCFEQLIFDWKHSKEKKTGLLKEWFRYGLIMKASEIKYCPLCATHF